MSESYDFGRQAERQAVDFLRKLGHQILHTNYYYLKGEIDIISIDKNAIVFTEVKALKSNYFGEPEQAVTPKKQQLIILTAHQYIIKNEIDKEARFDIIAIVSNSKVHKIKHIIDAFQSY